MRRLFDAPTTMWTICGILVFLAFLFAVKLWESGELQWREMTPEEREQVRKSLQDDDRWP